MNVSNNKPIQQATQAYSQKIQAAGQEDKAAAQSTEKGKSKVDEVTISEQALEMQKLLRQVQEGAEVRPEKVAEIQKQLQEGTYNVSSMDLADKILRLASGSQ